MGGVRKRGRNTRNLKGLQRIDASACGHRAGVACAGTGFLSWLAGAVFSRQPSPEVAPTT